MDKALLVFNDIPEFVPELLIQLFAVARFPPKAVPGTIENCNLPTSSCHVTETPLLKELSINAPLKPPVVPAINRSAELSLIKLIAE